MRLVAFVGAVLLLLVLAAAADAAAPLFIPVAGGSVWGGPRSWQLEQLPPDATCETSSGECEVRLAFRPDSTFSVWITVRNEGPVPMTIDGVSAWWLEDDRPGGLAHPTAQLLGGDPGSGGQLFPSDPTSLQPTRLDAGRERIVGLRFRTTDMPTACANSTEGSGETRDSVPFEWHVLLFRHSTDIEFYQPVTLMAPTAAQCSS